MKNFAEFDALEKRAFLASGLTRFPSLWNHPKTIEVAQVFVGTFCSRPSVRQG